MKNKRVFVSGGAGVIGREIVPKLANMGAIVLVGDLKSRPKEFPAEVKYRQGDLNAISSLELETFKPEIFIHLAATFERSTESKEFWGENFWHNVKLSHYLMTQIKECSSLRRVVFASSYLIYNPSLYQFDKPQHQPTKLKESDPIQPRNLTGMAKLSHEIELGFLDQFYSKEFTTVCARIFRGYGRNSRDVISRWIRLLLDEEPIKVYAPEGIFDYIYARDTAEGLIRLAMSGDVGAIINLGTGRSRSVGDVISILKQHFPRMRKEVEDIDLPFEASQADISLLKNKIGWSPEYDLELAIPEMIDFERKKKDESHKADAPLKLLVSSASAKAPLIAAAKFAAAKIDLSSKIVAGDLNKNTISRFIADEFWMMPKTNDDNFEQISQYCIANEINCVLPTRDGELEFWARNAKKFKLLGIHVIISAAEGIELTLDKYRFSKHCLSLGIPAINSYLDINNELNGGSWVVKERFGAGSRSMGLNLTKENALRHAKSLIDPIFQPYIEGKEISVDAYLTLKGFVKGLSLRYREIVVDGESQVTRTFRNSDLEERLKQILESLKLNGPVVMQVLIDKDGGIHVIECNARFGGASTAGIAVGVDSLYWALLESKGIPLNDYPFCRSSNEVRQVRIKSDSYVIDSGL
jgi:carbamoyl-phosphate synthase large subunit